MHCDLVYSVANEGSHKTFHNSWPPGYPINAKSLDISLVSLYAYGIVGNSRWPGLISAQVNT